jgi:hypothetical protein
MEKDSLIKLERLCWREKLFVCFAFYVFKTALIGLPNFSVNIPKSVIIWNKRIHNRSKINYKFE